MILSVERRTFLPRTSRSTRFRLGSSVARALLLSLVVLGSSCRAPLCDDSDYYPLGCEDIEGVCVVPVNPSTGGPRMDTEFLERFGRPLPSSMRVLLPCGDGLHYVYAASDGSGTIGEDGYPDPFRPEGSDETPAGSTYLVAAVPGQELNVGMVDFSSEPGECPYAWIGTGVADACVDAALAELVPMFDRCGSASNNIGDRCHCSMDRVHFLAPPGCEPEPRP